jgi:hypothetical protein
MSLTDPIPMTIAAIAAALIFVTFWRFMVRRRALLAQMQEITQPHITVMSLPKTNSEEAFVIKEGDREKMQASIEYAYFYGSLNPDTTRSQRYHTVTVFSLEKLQKPVYKSMTDAEVIAKLQEEGWRQTGSQAFGEDDTVTYYFQRSI